VPGHPANGDATPQNADTPTSPTAEQRHLEALQGAFGLAATTATVFAAAVGHTSADIATIARLAGQPLAQTRAELARLQRRGLLHDIAGVWEPTDPDSALRAEQAHQDALIAAQWAATLTRRAEQYQAALLGDTTSGDASELTLLDPQQSLTHIRQLIDNAETQVLCLIGGPPLPDDVDKQLLGALLDAADRGIAIASVWTPDSLAAAYTYDAGPRLRTATWIRENPNIHLRMISVDQQTAVVPLDADDPTKGAISIQAPTLRQLIANLIEQIYHDNPPPAATAGERRKPAKRNRKADVLTLLNEGLTEEAVATRLRVHERTVRRIIADLRGDLRVATNFQLGAAAYHHGLIPPPARSHPPRLR